LTPLTKIKQFKIKLKKRPEIQKLMKALQSPEVKKFIEEKYQGAVVPAF
jgi:D-methionine transport system substrate-binding protein